MRNWRTGDHVLRKWGIRGKSVRFAQQHWKFSEGSIYERIGLDKYRRRRRNKVDFCWRRRRLNLLICDSSVCDSKSAQSLIMRGHEAQGQTNRTPQMMSRSDCGLFKFARDALQQTELCHRSCIHAKCSVLRF